MSAMTMKRQAREAEVGETPLRAREAYEKTAG